MDFNKWNKKKAHFNFHQPSIFQEHAAQRCQRRKPKGGENGKRSAKLGNRLGKDNMHLSFSTSPEESKLKNKIKIVREEDKATCYKRKGSGLHI